MVSALGQAARKPGAVSVSSGTADAPVAQGQVRVRVVVRAVVLLLDMVLVYLLLPGTERTVAGHPSRTTASA